MSGADLPHKFQATSRTRFEISRRVSCSPFRPPGQAVPAVSLVVRGNVPNTNQLSDVDSRIASLEKNIQYLQQQHTETLKKLHAELDVLKRENKELKYRLTMDSSKGGKKGTTSNRNARSPFQLYEEEQLENTAFRDTAFRDQVSREVNDSVRSVQLHHHGELTGVRKTVLEPVGIKSAPIPSDEPQIDSVHIPSDLPPPSITQACEAVSNQELSRVNRLQTQEIARLKALLSDIILRKKITREHLVLSKTYLADEPRKLGEEKKCHNRVSHP